jgi:hypothetical protein
MAIRRDGEAHSLIRTDTYWRTDLPGRMDTLVIGDTVSSGGAWSRPVRYGGLRYARDFTLAPGYITYPTPSITASAALPSTVDLLVNNRRATSSRHDPAATDVRPLPTSAWVGAYPFADLAGDSSPIRLARSRCVDRCDRHANSWSGSYSCSADTL